jgi:hypothetical protein
LSSGGGVAGGLDEANDVVATIVELGDDLVGVRV